MTPTRSQDIGQWVTEITVAWLCFSVQGQSHPVQFSFGRCGPSQRHLTLTSIHDFPASATHLSAGSISLVRRQTPIAHCTSCVGPAGREKANLGKHDRYPQAGTQYFPPHYNLTQFQALQPHEPCHCFQCSRRQDKHHPSMAALGASVFIALVTPPNFATTSTNARVHLSSLKPCRVDDHFRGCRFWCKSKH